MLKCDNSTTCEAANYGVAGSVWEALRMWIVQCAQRNESVRLLYIDTKSKTIVDALIGAELDKEMQELDRRGWDRN